MPLFGFFVGFVLCVFRPAIMYEIEIKSLLGSKERADELKRQLTQLFPALRTLPSHKQRNFYFNTPDNLRVVEKAIGPLFSPEKQKELSEIIKGAKGTVSIRTRDADGKTLFIIKASIGDDTSENGVSRVEFEEPVKLSFDELNQRLIDAGLVFQAKWSREREQYHLGTTIITIDKNAGYGYLAEFEKMITTPLEPTGQALPLTGQVTQVKQELKALMATLGCEELEQARLERMFKFYNEHWQEYYGTDKVFVVE